MEDSSDLYMEAMSCFGMLDEIRAKAKLLLNNEVKTLKGMKSIDANIVSLLKNKILGFQKDIARYEDRINEILTMLEEDCDHDFISRIQENSTGESTEA